MNTHEKPDSAGWSPRPEPSRDASHLLQTVERLLRLLNKHQRDRHEGVRALLLAFVQAGVQVLDAGDEEQVEANREALIAMLAGAQRALERQGMRTPRATIH